MKTFKTIINTAFIAGTAILCSCSDYLDLVPKDALSDATYWKTTDDLKIYANRFYPGLPRLGGRGADNTSDDFISNNPNTLLFNQAIVPTSGGGWDYNSWANIRACNYFLNRYHSVVGNQEEIDRYVAEVRFFRALEYFNKVKSFGDVPWYNKDLQTSDKDALYKARDSRELVVDSIIADLDYAIEHLKAPDATVKGRIHKYAAAALKSRIALFEASYRKYRNLAGSENLFRESVAASELIINSGVYSIWNTGNPDKDYFNLFIQEDLTNNSEAILPFEYKKDVLMHNTTRQLEESYTGMSKALVESYLCKNGKPIAISEGLYLGDDSLMMELKNRDPRLLQSIDNKTLPFKIYSNGDVQIRPLPMIDPQWCTTGYWMMKYHSPDQVQWNADQSTLDLFVFRYAETLLNYAEAKAELGECTQEVLDNTINKLRSRVAMPHLTVNVGFNDPNWPDYGYSISPLLHEIRRERRIEFAGEGFRWNDIVRWAAGKLIEDPKSMLGMKVIPEMQDKYGDTFKATLNQDGYIIVYPNLTSRKWNDKLYLSPLPINELSINPNLTQNPGW